MKDYLANRQVAINDISHDKLNESMQQMIELLGDGWINQDEDHIIRRLWKRQDFLATNELLNLAHAIDLIKNVNLKWLCSQIKKVKSNNLNNIKGALFEIIGFSYLVNDEYRLELASEGNPGFDGTLSFSNGSKMNISMKHYGTSHFELDFNKEMDLVKKYYLELLENTNLITLQCLIRFKKYPEHSDFEAIKKELKKGVVAFAEGKGGEIFVKGGVLKVSNQIADIVYSLMKNHRFAKGTHSYFLLAISPLHINEFKNLIDKLEDACENLIRQKKEENANEINGIWIHLHENAAIRMCQKYLQEYLNGIPHKPISFINLYYPCVVRDPKNNSSTIFHTVLPIINPVRYKNWVDNNGINIPQFSFFLGNASMEVPQRKLISNEQEGLVIENRYIYQSGEIYEDAKAIFGNSFESEVINEASGVKINSVFYIDGKSIVIKGKFPEDDHLETM